MERLNITHENLYMFGNGRYRVLIIQNYTSYEAYLNRQDIGRWDLMFECPNKQKDKELTLSQFIKLVENNFNDYEEIYQEEYGEELPF